METGAEELGAPGFTCPLAGVLEYVRLGCQEEKPQPLSPRGILATCQQKGHTEFCSDGLEKSKTRGGGTLKPIVQQVWMDLSFLGS